MMSPRLYWGSLVIDGEQSNSSRPSQCRPLVEKPKRHTPKTQPSSNVVSFADYANTKSRRAIRLHCDG